MTTKDRTRFKNVTDYTEFASPDGCCCVPSTGAYSPDAKWPSTLQDCENNDGIFFNGAICDGVECPDAKKSGCCCSCTSTDFGKFFDDPTDATYPQNGLENDVTLCDCNKRNGRWYSGRCEDVDSLILCSNYDDPTIIDPRWPHACCHYADSDQQVLLCDNVCTVEDCANLPYPYSYYDDGSICGYPGPNGEPPLNCTQNRNMNKDFIHNSVVKDYASNFGHCMSYNKVGRYHECKLTTKFMCKRKNGFFVDIKYKKKNEGHVCGEFPLIVPKRRAQKKGPYIISKDEASKYNIGDDFYGLGIWCGIYDTNHSKLKLPVDITGDAVDVGIKEVTNNKNRFKSWAIIIDYEDITHDKKIYSIFTPPANHKGNNTSLHDGYFNTVFYGNGSSFYNIKNYQQNGVGGYYIPSLWEWGYLQKNIFDDVSFINNTLTNEITKNFSFPISFSYISSSLYGEDMVYYYSPSLKISNNEMFDLNDVEGIRNYYNLKNSQKNDIHNNIRLQNAFYPTINMNDLTTDEIIKFKEKNITNPLVFLSPLNYNPNIRLIKRLVID